MSVIKSYTYNSSMGIRDTFEKRSYTYNSSMGIRDTFEKRLDPRMYEEITFLDSTTGRYFKAKPVDVVRAWRIFILLVKGGHEPTLNVFYNELGLPLNDIVGKFIIRKEPVLGLHVCENVSNEYVIGITVEVF